MILNLAAYHFVAISDPDTLAQQLRDRFEAASLRGTALVTPEGINLFLAGRPEAVDDWLAEAGADPRLAALAAKRSFSAQAPFQRLKVKIKREIIRMNMPTVRPAAGRAPAVDARTLARWLAQGHCDAGRPVTMLDTRNGFEVDRGAFEGAIDWRLQRFSEFPAALARHRDSLRDKTIVSYCTGGIRCEKAAIWMREQGLPHTLQLDGGILKYFEDMPGAPHWRGECFVFDQRTAVKHGLAVGDHTLCHGCRMPVSPADRASPLYEAGVSCPACHGARDDDQRQRYAERARQMEHGIKQGVTHLGVTTDEAKARQTAKHAAAEQSRQKAGQKAEEPPH